MVEYQVIVCDIIYGIICLGKWDISVSFQITFREVDVGFAVFSNTPTLPNNIVMNTCELCFW